MFFLLAYESKAQVTPMIGSLYTSRMLTNPSYFTVRGLPSVHVYRKSEWSSFPGAPTTYAGVVEAPLTREFAPGLIYQQDAAGATTKRRVTLAGAYNLYIDDINEISLGLGLGFYNQVLDQSKLTNISQYKDDPNITSYNSFGIDGDLGFYYQYDRTVGVSVCLPNVKSNFIDQKPARTLDGSFLNVGLNGMIMINGDEIQVEPATNINLTKDYGTYFQLGARGTYQNKLSLSLLYDIKGSFSYGLSFMYDNKFLISTYHLLNLSDAKNVSGSSLEFGLMVFFGETPFLSYE